MHVAFGHATFGYTMTSIECKIEGQIAILSLNRPLKANAYTPAMLQEINRLWDQLEQDTRIVIIASKGDGAFCGGADLQEMKQATAADALDLLSQRVFNRIAQSNVVSIAAIQGPAVAGGFELTLACDLRIASSGAWFALPEVSKGLIPAAGGCTRLTALLGASIAKGMILGGERISCQQGLSWGLIHRTSETPADDAFAWAEQLLHNDVLALKLAKRVLSAPSLEAERLAEALLYEQKNTASQH